MHKALIIIGSILAAIGVLCFLSLIGQNREDIRSIGSAFFALGVLIMASGIYLQARAIKAQFEPAAAAKVKKAERVCSSCNREPAVLFCRVHVLRLCLNCFEKHDDGSNCSYVPARRATAAYR